MKQRRNIFEIWNKYLQNGCVPSSCMRIDEQLVVFHDVAYSCIFSFKNRNI